MTAAPPEGSDHVYLSTACLHGHHAHCQCEVNLAGEPKEPGRCKWCESRCICECHADVLPEIANKARD